MHQQCRCRGGVSPPVPPMFSLAENSNPDEADEARGVKRKDESASESSGERSKFAYNNTFWSSMKESLAFGGRLSNIDGRVEQSRIETGASDIGNPATKMWPHTTTYPAIGPISEMPATVNSVFALFKPGRPVSEIVEILRQQSALQEKKLNLAKDLAERAARPSRDSDTCTSGAERDPLPVLENSFGDSDDRASIPMLAQLKQTMRQLHAPEAFQKYLPAQVSTDTTSSSTAADVTLGSVSISVNLFTNIQESANPIWMYMQTLNRFAVDAHVRVNDDGSLDCLSFCPTISAVRAPRILGTERHPTYDVFTL